MDLGLSHAAALDKGVELASTQEDRVIYKSSPHDAHLTGYDCTSGSSTSHVATSTSSRERAKHSSKARSCLAWASDKQRFLACLWSTGASGWSDACLGALLPFIEDYYNIGYRVVSVLFLATCIGYFLVTCTNTTITAKLGRGKALVLGASIQVIGYAMLIAAPPFPVLPFAWVIVGYGAATQLAQTNSYGAEMPNREQALGSLHGAYGLGGAASPLVATAFVSAGIKFSYFFAVSLSFSVVNAMLLLYTFRLRASDDVDDSVESMELTGREEISQEREHIQKGPASMLEVLKLPMAYSMSFFLMLYCGAEVATGGWIVTYLQEELGGTTSAGYAATGFWLGITLGRVLLPRFNLFVGERRVVYLYLLVALSLQFVVWFSKNLYAAATCTALVGFFIGPFFPNSVSLATKIFAKRYHLAAISLFCCLGSCGNALFPFMTGMLASVYGIWVLQPVMVSLFVGMAAMWSLLPRVDRRAE